jgi:hypothetical protein
MCHYDYKVHTYDFDIARIPYTRGPCHSSTVPPAGRIYSCMFLFSILVACQTKQEETNKKKSIISQFI